jgi:molecular chaperone Hsp33
VQITFLGQGPLGQMTTVANGPNLVKGFVGNPLCQPPLKESGKVSELPGLLSLLIMSKFI